MTVKKITKADLVDAIYEQSDCDKLVVAQIVEKFVETLKTSLSEGCTIELRRFGTFEPRLRKGRSAARNPRTGERITSKPHYVAAFRAGKELKQRMAALEQDALSAGSSDGKNAK